MSISIDAAGSSAAIAGGTGNTSAETRILNRIEVLNKQLKTLVSQALSAESSKEREAILAQRKMIQSEISMLQAELAKIQLEQFAAAQNKKEIEEMNAATKTSDGAPQDNSGKA
ncbi:hypothetical protein HC231_14285 [Brenneria izadpanahii]|uniref:FlxA-like protein n=1 Tax=Brenneria izadpanahii TaxID=2722756 RepID=A0ABX7UT64_9GAMM|nr:FlxA-like family protein [Brenneria izadpanahii]QTF08946.1 hypothetical protein HC231_14285 [Brenneria izadpanahii]